MKQQILNEEIIKVNTNKINSLLKNVCVKKDACPPLAVSNTNILKKYFLDIGDLSNLDFVLVAYGEEETIVTNGKTSSPYLLSSLNYNYSEVPLGYIISGDIIVSKGGKATKHLSEGDFIGLFEASDWALTGKKREIGDWTLKTSSNTKILFFPSQSLLEENNAAHSLKDYLIDIARTDRVPQPITNMPLLDWVSSHTTKSRLSDYVVVIHTHLLPNTFPFFRHLSYLTNFGKVYILEKPYSTVRSTYNDLVQAGCEIVQVKMESGMPYEFSVRKSVDILWSKIIEEQKQNDLKKLLVVDDGGDLWHSIPWNNLKGVSVAGVEQTQRGITRIESSQIKIPPIISVASSGIKKVIESQFIGKSVVDKLDELKLIDTKKRIGILGMGSIGLAVAKTVNELGHKVSYYDPSPGTITSNLIKRCLSLDDLLNSADLIIGTVGKDSLKGMAFDRVSGEKIMVSASSADVEFSSLLKLTVSTETPFGTRKIQVNRKLKIEILNGGYPLNFDRVKNATPSEDIALTWCLMYIGAMQAAELIKEDKLLPRIYEVDHLSQKRTFEKWLENINNRQKIDMSKNDVSGIINQPNSKINEMKSVWNDE